MNKKNIIISIIFLVTRCTAQIPTQAQVPAQIKLGQIADQTKQKKPIVRKKIKRPVSHIPAPASSSVTSGTPANPVTKTPTSPDISQAPINTTNLPQEFSDDGAHAEVVTVGSSRDGKIEAWKIGNTDFALYRYDQNSVAPDAWVKQVTKDDKGTVITAFDDISTSSDGVVCAISSSGKAYMLNTSKNYWEEIPASNSHRLKFGKISVGSANNIWTIEKATNNIYQLLFNKESKIGGLKINSNEWVLKSINGLDVAAGIDGTVIAISTQNKVYQLVNNTWKEIPGLQLTNAAVGSKDLMWATFDHGTVHELWKLVPDVTTPTWQKVLGANGQPSQNIVSISVNASGTVFATDTIGTIYNNGDTGVIITSVTPEQLKQQQPGQFVQLSEGLAATKSKITSQRSDAKKAGKIAPIKPDPKLVALKKSQPQKIKVAKPNMRRGGTPVVTAQKTVVQKK